MNTKAKRNILLVDDEIAFLYPMKKLMQNENINVHITDNLSRAMRLLAETAFDAVIVDVNLGGSANNAGLSVLESAKAKCPSTKVLVMTGFGEPAIMKLAYQNGADYYFEKPVSARTLSSALQALGIA